MSILTWYEINADHISIKFDTNILASTIVNSNFTLSQSIDNVLTPIPDAFQPIVVTRDYYSISRTLILYLANDLASLTSYRLDIQNLRDINNMILPAEWLTWTTEATVGIDDVTPPSRDPVDVEDYSIKSINDFLIIPTSSDTVSSIAVTDVYPTDSLSYNVASTFVEGRIQLTFNADIAANYISSTYFKVQRRWIDSPTTPVWEDLPIYVTSDGSDVYIYLPSDDATPVYGQVGYNYWLDGYKYRLRVLAGLGAV